MENSTTATTATPGAFAERVDRLHRRYAAFKGNMDAALRYANVHEIISTVINELQVAYDKDIAAVRNGKTIDDSLLSAHPTAFNIAERAVLERYGWYSDHKHDLLSYADAHRIVESICIELSAAYAADITFVENQYDTLCARTAELAGQVETYINENRSTLDMASARINILQKLVEYMRMAYIPLPRDKDGHVIRPNSFIENWGQLEDMWLIGPNNWKVRGHDTSAPWIQANKTAVIDEGSEGSDASLDCKHMLECEYLLESLASVSTGDSKISKIMERVAEELAKSDAEAHDEECKRRVEQGCDAPKDVCTISFDPNASQQCQGPVYSCSKCGTLFMDVSTSAGTFKFCPECGKKAVVVD